MSPQRVSLLLGGLNQASGPAFSLNPAATHERRFEAAQVRLRKQDEISNVIEKAKAAAVFWGSFAPISNAVKVTDRLRHDLKKSDFKLIFTEFKR